MELAKLIQMANQIGEFFGGMSDRGEALSGIANHLQKFWAPKMRGELLEASRAGKCGDLSPIVAETLRVHRERLVSGLPDSAKASPERNSAASGSSRPPSSVAVFPVRKVAGSRFSEVTEPVSVEEPLEIRINYPVKSVRRERVVAITMRTPGEDFELAAGYLYTEGILAGAGEIADIGRDAAGNNLRQDRNRVTIRLKEGIRFDPRTIRRNAYINSSCGICGKTSIENLKELRFPLFERELPVIEGGLIHRLPETLRKGQSAFNRTGGLHAAALFKTSGEMTDIREDVGRHNAVDKLIGQAFLKDRLPLSDHILLVSGRTSFELVQKTLMAGIPILVSVGAPSSLSVEAALRYQMTLVGFTRENRFNIYSGFQRVALQEEAVGPVKQQRF